MIHMIICVYIDIWQEIHLESADKNKESFNRVQSSMSALVNLATISYPNWTCPLPTVEQTCPPSAK